MKKYKSLKTTLKYQSLIIPALVLYILFVTYPFFSTIYYSFTNYNKYHIFDFNIVGFVNYFRMFDINILKVALLNSIKYAFFMTFFQSLIAIPIAVFLNRKMKMTNFYRAAFFLPAMFSPLVMGYLWQIMLGPNDTGLINKFLIFIGLSPFDFLSSQNAVNSIILTQVWQWVGWAVIIYLANLQTISEDLYEAAKIDGANKLQIFFRITLPLLCPGATVVLISSLVGGLKVYDIVQSMTKGGPGYSSETILTAMIKVGFGEGNYSLAAAFGVVFFLLVMFFTMILMYFIRKWERRIS